MTEIGKMLVGLGLVILAAGTILLLVGKDQPAYRPIAGRHPLSRETHHVLFSVGDFNCGECSAIGGVVSGRKDQALDF